jgi:hypothetical protein
MAPKTLGLSMRGWQHQSMEPLREIKATVLRLPMTPYRSIGV